MEWLKMTGRVLLGISVVKTPKEANKLVDGFVTEFKNREEIDLDNYELSNVDVDLDAFGKGELVDGVIHGLRNLRRVDDCKILKEKGDEIIILANFSVDNVEVVYHSNIEFFGKRHPLFTFTADQILFSANISLDKLTGELLPERCTGDFTKMIKFRVKITEFGTLITPFVNMIARLTRTEIKRTVELYIRSALKKPGT